jgi:AraC-like DNA-binding protein
MVPGETDRLFDTFFGSGILMKKSEAETGTDPISFGWMCKPIRLQMTHARFRHQQFSPHSHEDWSLCAVINGSKNIALPSKPQQLVHAGDVYLLHPEQAHAGNSVDDGFCEYVMMLIPDDEWRKECARRALAIPYNGVAPFHHPLLSLEISTFVLQVLAHSDKQLDWSESWTNLLDYLFESHASFGVSVSSEVCDARMYAARDYLRKNWNGQVSLQMLGDHTALSRFELVRRFGAAYGLPPHRYQTNLRIMHAKSQLLNGRPIAEVSTATGFSDQSHLGRVFKSILGITPGALGKQISKYRGR